MEEGVGLTGEESGPKKRDRSTFLDKEGGGGGGVEFGWERRWRLNQWRGNIQTQQQDSRKI